MSSKKRPITKALERAVIHLILTDQRFYALIARALPSSMLPTENGRTVLDLAHAFYKGAPPSAHFTVHSLAQRLARKRADGQMTVEEADEVFDWVDALVVGEPPNRAGIAHELAEEIKRVRHNENVQHAMEAFSKHGDMLEVANAITETEKLGKQSSELRAGGWDDDTDLLPPLKTEGERLSTGVATLDDAMDGGIPDSTLFYALGSSGAGKSMCLSQVAACGLQQNLDPYIATLEVSEDAWNRRLRAAASNVSLRAIRNAELTEQDIAQIRGARKGAIAWVQEFSPGISTAEDVLREFDLRNAELRKMGSTHQHRVLIVDYADKLAWPAHVKGTYDGQRHVYETLRQGARDRKIWVVTASQASRREKRKAKDTVLTMEDSADSIHKARIADIVVTLNISSDRSLIRLFLDKMREGPGGFLSDYIETAYDYGRITVATEARAYRESMPPPPDPEPQSGVYKTGDLPF